MPRIPNIAWFVIMPVAILALWLLAARYIKAATKEPVITSEQVEATKRSAAVIVAAIQKYKATKGRVPLRLEELVPDYMPSIPVPDMPYRSWEYSMLEEEGTSRRIVTEFFLGFATTAARRHAWWWDSRRGEWSEVTP